MQSPKDKPDDFPGIQPEETESSSAHIEAPNGLDLHPEVPKVVRVSKRASMVVVGIGIALLLAFAYGGYKRTKRAQAAARESTGRKAVVPATQASREFTNSIPTGTVPLEHANPGGLQLPTDNAAASIGHAQRSCGTDPRTGVAYRYDPETGRPCDSVPQERTVVRQIAVAQPQAVRSSANPQPTPEEQALAAAYQREREAEIAPTAIGSSGSQGFGGSVEAAGASGCAASAKANHSMQPLNVLAHNSPLTAVCGAGTRRTPRLTIMVALWRRIKAQLVFAYDLANRSVLSEAIS